MLPKLGDSVYQSALNITMQINDTGNGYMFFVSRCDGIPFDHDEQVSLLTVWYRAVETDARWHFDAAQLSHAMIADDFTWKVEVHLTLLHDSADEAIESLLTSFWGIAVLHYRIPATAA